MSSVALRRCKRIAVSKTKKDSKAEPQVVAPPKTTAILGQKRARALFTETNDTRSSDKKPRKRAKTSATVNDQATPAKKGRRRGKLMQITEVPLDVLYEIFSFLEPLDLLRLSRTTKSLRLILMNRHSITIWKSSLLGIQVLPPMIEGLTEPQYASLLYDDHCHKCLKTPTNHILWQIRTRLCKECLASGTIMATSGKLPPEDKELRILAPRFKLVDVQGVSFWYHRSTIQRLAAESEHLPRDSQQYQEWVETQTEELTALINSCKPYERWEEARAAEMASLRRHRLESTVAHLKVEGWEPELSHRSVQDALARHRHVAQAKELTDENWRSIRPSLTALMSKLRVQIETNYMREIITKRTRLLTILADPILREMPETPHKPLPSALCTLQPFLGIIQDTPLEEDVTDRLKKTLESVADVCAQWRREQEARLKAMLRRKPGRSDDLSLVVNAFSCTDSDCRRRYPSMVLHHPHFALHPCFFTKVPVGNTGVEVKVWRGQSIKALNNDVYERCRAFVKMCGLDPDTATEEDMDALDMFFRCEDCDADRLVPPPPGATWFGLKRWRAAMNDPHPAKMSRVEDAALVAAARRKEKLHFEEDLSRAPGRYFQDREEFVCVHCGVADGCRIGRAEHLREAHGIEDGFKLQTEHYRRSLKCRHANGLAVRIAWTKDGEASEVVDEGEGDDSVVLAPSRRSAA